MWLWPGLSRGPALLNNSIEKRSVELMSASFFFVQSKSSVQSEYNTASILTPVTSPFLSSLLLFLDHRCNWSKCLRSHRVVPDRFLVLGIPVLFLIVSRSQCFLQSFHNKTKGPFPSPFSCLETRLPSGHLPHAALPCPAVSPLAWHWTSVGCS